MTGTHAARSVSPSGYIVPVHSAQRWQLNQTPVQPFLLQQHPTAFFQPVLLLVFEAVVGPIWFMACTTCAQSTPITSAKGWLLLGLPESQTASALRGRCRPRRLFAYRTVDQGVPGRMNTPSMHQIIRNTEATRRSLDLRPPAEEVPAQFLRRMISTGFARR